MPSRVALDHVQRRDERKAAALVVSDDGGEVRACRAR
jgi:hypothetical protein